MCGEGGAKCTMERREGHLEINGVAIGSRLDGVGVEDCILNETPDQSLLGFPVRLGCLTMERTLFTYQTVLPVVVFILTLTPILDFLALGLP